MRKYVTDFLASIGLGSGALVLVAALSLAGCAALQKVEDVYTAATTTVVPASVVVPAANAFDILKGTAGLSGQYCVEKAMVPAICSADIRRVVVRAIRSGTAARDQLEVSLQTGQPAAASVYNVLIAAVNNLKATPAATFMPGAGGSQ